MTTQSKKDGANTGVRAAKPQKMTGAQALVASLRAEGVSTIFGYPGSVVLPIYDALLDAAGDIEHILVRHEQGAIHAADGYARATGRVGVALVTSGPGATNAVTGIANAYMDSIPLVVITGQVASSVLGTDAFQESDITGITLPITKHNYLLKDARELPRTLKEAFHIASTGRPGPVLIDIPVDVSRQEIAFEYPEKATIVSYKPTVKGNAKQIKAAAALVEKAQRPLLYAGGGVVAANASTSLKALAELMQIPVTTTLMGKGAFPETHHLSLGMPGMHGAKYTNLALSECDLLIAVGVRFDDRVTGKLDEFAERAKVIHIDIDPAEIGKNVTPDIPVVGDANSVLAALVEELRKTGVQPVDESWLARLDEYRSEFPLRYEQRDDEVTPEFVVERVGALIAGKDVVITTEVGQNQMWAAQYIKLDTPRSFVSSGGLGTMGFGLPAAIGAQAGRPDALVIDIAGDGSIQMNSQEMATAMMAGLPVKVVLLNNGCLGMVRQWQELFYGKRYSQSKFESDLVEASPDFVKLAEAYGWMGLRVERPSELDAALTAAFDHDGPALVDVRVAGEECVFPMVAPGNSIDEMLGGVPGGPVSEMIEGRDQ